MGVRFDLGSEDQVLRVTFDEPLAEHMFPVLRKTFTEYYERGIRRIVVDRRNGTDLDVDAAMSFGSELGKMCSRYQAKVAVIVNDDDIMEYIVCGGAFTSGANMITTPSEREAEQWISGQVR